LSPWPFSKMRGSTFPRPPPLSPFTTLRMMARRSIFSPTLLFLAVSRPDRLVRRHRSAACPFFDSPRHGVGSREPLSPSGCPALFPFRHPRSSSPMLLFPHRTSLHSQSPKSPRNMHFSVDHSAASPSPQPRVFPLPFLFRQMMRRTARHGLARDLDAVRPPRCSFLLKVTPPPTRRPFCIASPR